MASGPIFRVKITFHGLDWEDRLGSIHAILRGSKNLNRKVSALLAQEPVLTEQVCQKRTESSAQPARGYWQLDSATLYRKQVLTSFCIPAEV